MSEYIYAKRDFENWIRSLDYETTNKPIPLDDYQKAIINILYENFDEIASADGWDDESRHSDRVELLSNLMRKIDPENLNTQKPEFSEDAYTAQSIRYLTSLEVRNFRGFQGTCLFEFKNSEKIEKNRKPTRYNLFYGPNGSGKTSFCEALEYAILGTIEDAQVKGIDLERYIVHGGDEMLDSANGNHCFVELKGTDSLRNDGSINKEIVIKANKANLERYRFAFIERRRIDGFSHIGSHSSNELERIAVLFGHGQFFEFVKELSRASRPLSYMFYRLDREQKEKQKKKRSNDQFHEEMSRAIRHISFRLEQYVLGIVSEADKGILKDTCTYYNNMNTDDSEDEKLKEIKFVGTGRHRPFLFYGSNRSDSCIEITFKSGVRGNALRLLSEGHIKLLGLAMLLAKAKKDNVPFLIFDDIVNAIDDDHREGIAELLLNDEDLSDKQLFLTCHGDVFLEQIKKYTLGVNKKCPKVIISSFSFLGSHLRKSGGIEFRRDGEKAETKINLAQEYLDWGRKRDCTAACRQAMEIITERLWKGIGKGLPLTLQLYLPNSRPDLENVTAQICKQIHEALNRKNDPFTLDTKSKKHLMEIKNKLDFLLENRRWNLLNKGVHEDSTTREFPRKEAQMIVDTIHALSENTQDLLNYLKNSKIHNKDTQQNNGDSSKVLDYTNIQNIQRKLQDIIEKYKKSLRSTCEAEQEITSIISELDKIAKLDCLKIISPN